MTFAYSLLMLGSAGAEQSTLAQVPTSLVLDRLYVHGHPTLSFQRCILLNSASTAIVDSYISDCHSRTNDSQAIGGWNGPGPFSIVNNYLEGAGENVMFGGGDPSIADLVPSDIEIRRNHFRKPLAWQGAGWIIKNLFEIKNARRVLVEGNVFENNWVGADQAGFAIVWYSSNEGGTAPWSTASDVTFQYNIVRRSVGGIAMSARSGNPAVPAARYRIAHNVFEQIGDSALPSDWRAGRLWQVSEVAATEFAHNTGVGTTNGFLMLGQPTSGGLVVRDNVFGGGPGIASADGQGYGTRALDYHFPGWTTRGNVLIGSAATQAAFPADNVYATTATAAGLSADLRPIAAPALGSATTDGLPVGADRAAVEQKTAGVVQP